MKRIILITCSLLISLSCLGQRWQQMLSAGETDFRKIQKAFYKEWKDKPIRRGNGYKLFKRWEHFMSTRLDRKGRITNSSKNYFVNKSLKRSVNLAAKDGDELNQWRSLGMKSWFNGNFGYNPGNGRINCVTTLPNSEYAVYIGAPVGGIWKKNGDDSDWEILSEELVNVGVTDIYINPENPDTIYILTGDAYGSNTHSIGILKSINGGDSWEMTGLKHEEYSNRFYYKMEVLPSKTNIMLVAGNSGIERSTDSGETWNNVFSEYNFSDMIVHPIYDSIIYASANNAIGSSVVFFKSDDWGETWQDLSFESNILNDIGRTALAVSINEPDYVYLLGADNFGGYGGLYRSEDAGENFDKISSRPNIVGSNPDGDGGQGSYDLALAVNPANAMEVYVGGFFIYKSTDGGDTFDRVNKWDYTESDLPYVHADIHTLDFYNGELFVGCDGGIFRSSNQGASWRDLSQGLDISQFYRIGLDPNDESVVIGGTQDNGSNILINDKWFHIFGADGMEALVDHTDGNIVYQSVQLGRINKFTDKGSTYLGRISGPPITGQGGWVTPYQMDPLDHEILYAGFRDVMKTVNAGDSWEQISNFRINQFITDLQVSKTNPDYIYVTDGDNLMMTKDGGTSWQSVSEGLPLETVSRIAISKNNPERTWVTLGGFSDGEKVYYSADAGKNWENISEGLPNIPVNCIVHQRNSENQLYLGTDIGVFQRKSGDEAWQLFSAGLPSVIINELEIHEASGKIKAATFGRGVWETETLISTVNPLVINEVTPDLNVILAGESVNFSADISGSVSGYFWEFEGGIPPTSESETPFAFYNEPGEYDVKLTVKGIIENKTVTVEKLVSVNKILSVSENDSFFNVYPNPAKETLQISFESLLDKFSYQLINTEGKVIMQERSDRPTVSLQISLNSIDNGIYFLKVMSENKQYTRKVVISN